MNHAAVGRGNGVQFKSGPLRFLGMWETRACVFWTCTSREQQTSVVAEEDDAAVSSHMFVLLGKHSLFLISLILQ